MSKVTKKPRPSTKNTVVTARSGEFPVVPSGGVAADPRRDLHVSADEVKVSTSPIQGGCGWHDGETLADAIRKQVAWAMTAVVEAGLDNGTAMDPEDHSIMYALHRLLTLSLEVDELAHTAARHAAQLAKLKAAG